MIKKNELNGFYAFKFIVKKNQSIAFVKCALYNQNIYLIFLKLICRNYNLAF